MASSLQNAIKLLQKLHSSPSLQHKPEVFSSLALPDLQALFALFFMPQSALPCPRTHLTYLLFVVRKSIHLTSSLFAQEKFEPMTIFGFLMDGNPSWEMLSLLEQILLPLAKRQPSKILNVIAQHQQLQTVLAASIHHQPVFKIIYTTLFCLDAKESHPHESTLLLLMKLLLNVALIGDDLTYGIQEHASMTENLRGFFNDITINSSSVEMGTLASFISLAGQDYISALMKAFKRSLGNLTAEEYCQGLIQVLIGFLKLTETMKFLFEGKSETDQQLQKIIEAQLVLNAKAVAKHMPYIMSLLIKSNPKKNFLFSSGQCLESVGQVKYRLLELIEKLYSLNQVEDLEINREEFDIFDLTKKLISRHKWNNIIHTLLVKIVSVQISGNYGLFKRRHMDAQDHSGSFLAWLIFEFRNHKYIHLETMRMTTLGNRQIIYELSKLLIYEMQKAKDLTPLMGQFPHWKHFIEHELADYEREFLSPSRYFDERTEMPTNGNLKSSIIDHSQKSEKSFQSIQEILRDIEEERKWLPKPITGNRTALQKTMLKFDSMRSTEGD